MENNYETKIIDILGKNHLTPIHFYDVINYDEIYGLYTYKGTVCVFCGGKDLDFSDLVLKEQERVYNMVLSKKWKKNKSLQ